MQDHLPYIGKLNSGFSLSKFKLYGQYGHAMFYVSLSKPTKLKVDGNMLV